MVILDNDTLKRSLIKNNFTNYNSYDVIRTFFNCYVDDYLEEHHLYDDLDIEQITETVYFKLVQQDFFVDFVFKKNLYTKLELLYLVQKQQHHNIIDDKVYFLMYEAQFLTANMYYDLQHESFFSITKNQKNQYQLHEISVYDIFVEFIEYFDMQIYDVINDCVKDYDR